MSKMTSVCSIFALVLAACGGGGAGAQGPKTAALPAGSGWSCHHDGESAIHACYRGADACKTAAAGKGECVDAKTASCMTYNQDGSDHWTCFDDGATCGKFSDFMKKKGATEVSSCGDQG